MCACRPVCKKWELGPCKRAPLLMRSCTVGAAEEEAHGREGRAKGELKAGLMQARAVESPGEGLRAPRISRNHPSSSLATTEMLCGRMYSRWREAATLGRASPPLLGCDREACAWWAPVAQFQTLRCDNPPRRVPPLLSMAGSRSFRSPAPSYPRQHPHPPQDSQCPSREQLDKCLEAMWWALSRQQARSWSSWLHFWARVTTVSRRTTSRKALVCQHLRQGYQQGRCKHLILPTLQPYNRSTTSCLKTPTLAILRCRHKTF
jgi:hypothetical protein